MPQVVIFCPSLTPQAKYEIEKTYLPLAWLETDEVEWVTTGREDIPPDTILVVAVGEGAWREMGGRGNFSEWRGFLVT